MRKLQDSSFRVKLREFRKVNFTADHSKVNLTIIYITISMINRFLSTLFFSHLLQYHAEIIKYSNHIINPDRPEYLIIPKFAAYEVPNWYPGDGRSFIDLTDVIIHSSCDSGEKEKVTLPAEDADLSCVDATFEVRINDDDDDDDVCIQWL